MKTVLCFGDSNTFGYIPGGLGRFSESERYTGILSTLLGSEYNVVEDGVVGRTTLFEDPLRTGKCGIKDIKKSVLAANPDIFVVALGTNDVKKVFNNSESSICSGVESIIKTVLSVKPDTEIIVMAPAPISSNALTKSDDYDLHSLEVSKNLHKKLEKYSKEHNYKYLNIGSFASVSPEDGEHLAAESHKITAEKLYDVIKNI